MRFWIHPVITLMLGFLLMGCAGTYAPLEPFVTFECRLSVWPAFEPPFEYLVQKEFERITITEFNYRGAGGDKPRFSGAPVVRNIDPKQWKQFSEVLRRSNPWTLPSEQPYKTGSDGTFMIIDLRDGNRQHRIQRWAPFHLAEDRYLEFATAIIEMLPQK